MKQARRNSGENPGALHDSLVDRDPIDYVGGLPLENLEHSEMDNDPVVVG
jgi:hypothetical protein